MEYASTQAPPQSYIHAPKFIFVFALSAFVMGFILCLEYVHPIIKLEPLWRLLIAILYFAFLTFYAYRRQSVVEEFCVRLCDFEKRACVFFLLFWLGSTYICGTPLLSNIIFFLIGLIPLWMLLPFFKSQIKASAIPTRIALVFILFTCIQVITPGLFIPPFSDGISGWTKHISNSTKINMRGLKFVNRQGKEQWFSFAYADPAAFQHWTIDITKDTLGPSLYGFYFEVYRKYWKTTQKGRTPNQHLLGKFAYPGHNDYRPLDYTGFEPDNIVKIILVLEQYDQHTFKFIKRTEYNEWIVPPELASHRKDER